MDRLHFNVPEDEIAQFCVKWKITEFAVFGSAVRGDWNPESDLDVLVTFVPETGWSLFDHMRMEEELTRLFERKIDLFSKKAVESSHNWLRRREILSTAEVIYGAG